MAEDNSKKWSLKIYEPEPRPYGEKREGRTDDQRAKRSWAFSGVNG